MPVTSSIRGSAAGFGRAALVFLAATFLASCGSGAVTDNTTTTPTAITILPSAATLYSGLPTTFTWSGGNGSYVIASSDQSAVPLGGSTNATSLTVVPGPVTTDTNVTLTVRDTAGSQATAALVVKPRTISNVITVTPSSTQAAVCGSALCSGGDAEVRTTLVQNGVPLSNRDVRFDVVSGDVRFIVGSSGGSELLSSSTTARTDSAGNAAVRIRAFTDAAAQTALLQITDVSGGFTQRASVTVYPVNSVVLSAAPATVQFTGPNTTSCASGTSADVIVFGGRAPYQITQPAGFQVTPTLLTGTGQRFTITSTGQCAAAQPVTIVDANGRSASVQVSNVVGTIAATPPAPFVVSPTEVTLDSCGAQANVTLSGGLGTYYGAGTNTVTAVANGSLGTIKRESGAATSTPVQVAFSDGRSAVSVTVNLGTGALGACP